MALCIYSFSEVSLHRVDAQELGKGSALAVTDAQRMGDESVRGGRRARGGSLPKLGKEVHKAGYCPTQSNSV